MAMTPSTEHSNLQITDDPDEIIKQNTRILEQIAQIDPAQLHCIMVIAVTNMPPDHPNKNKVDTHITGTDQDIAKMLTTLARVAKNGVTQINSTKTPPPNESRH